jgi:endoglucanase
MRWVWFFLLPLSLLARAEKQVRAISFFGLETPLKNTMCSWVKPYDYYLAAFQRLGFNTLRLPFSMELIDNYEWDIMDKVVRDCGKYNLSVILDLHRIEARWQGPNPFYSGKTLADLINTWYKVLWRYEQFDWVTSMNIYNENSVDNIETINDYSRQVVEAVEQEFPNRYIYYITGAAWSGNLRGINVTIEGLDDRIFYSCHKYSWSGSGDRHDWDESFGFLPPEKVIVGEFGWVESTREWGNRFIDYLLEKKIYNFCYWSQSQSGDTIDLWSDSDCITFNWDDYWMLHRLFQNETDNRRYLRNG